MKALICTLFMLLSSAVNQGVRIDHMSNSAKNKMLTLENTDHELLNEIVLIKINTERTRQKSDPLILNSSLQRLAKQSQDLLEFRTFNDAKKIQSKINKQIKKKLKLTAYEGGLSESVAQQQNAINYKKGEPFFYVKHDKNSKLGLYYGTKKDLKNKKIKVQKIPNYTYEQFANALVNSLTSKQKKILYSSAYQDIGLQLNWYYKSLHKRKIPQIKMIAILGGYITAGARKIQGN